MNRKSISTAFFEGGAKLSSPPWCELLPLLATTALQAAQTSGRQPTGRKNAKGHIVKAFDIAADQAARNYLEQAHIDGLLETEEGEPYKLGREKPNWRIVIDPVDGSDNFVKGLPLSAFSCAVLRMDALLAPDNVEAGIVAPVEGGPPFQASRHKGAKRGETILRTSEKRKLKDSIISIELNHLAPPRWLSRVMEKAAGVRSYGCASRALALVASGAIDAHIDIRDRLTAESYLAGALLVLEAGGCVVAPDGSPLAGVRTLTDRHSLIAAASNDLAGEIVQERNENVE